MSLKTKDQKGNVFLANGKNSWIVCYRFRNAEIYRCFFVLTVFGPEPIYQRVSKGDVTILITTLNLYERKVKQLVELTSSWSGARKTHKDTDVTFLSRYERT
jgi:hypothetical protein